MQLPHGWTLQYAVQWCVDRLQQQKNDEDLRQFVDELTQRVVDLEVEVSRLEQAKADRKGRKPIAQG